MIVRLSLPAAIASILGKRTHDDYRDVGQLMNAKDLYKLMGLTGSPMLYNYMNGKTKSIEPERAVVLLDKFDILVDEWLTPEELKGDVTNKELSLKIAREPVRQVMDELIEVEANEDIYALRKGLRKLIARYY